MKTRWNAWLVVLVLVAVFGFAGALMAASVPGDFDYNGRITFNPGARVTYSGTNVYFKQGGFFISETNVTATAAQLNNTVQVGAIGAGSISNAALAATAVTGNKIVDGTISNVDLAADCITGPKIASGAVSNSAIADVDAGKLTGTIQGARFGALSVSNAAIADDAVGADELAADSVVKGSLAAGDFGDFTAGADGTCELDANVVTATEILNATVTDAKLATLYQSGTVTADADHTIITQAFATAYGNGVVPVVVATYIEDPGDVKPIYATAVSNQVLFSVTADKDFNWMASGAR